MRSRVLGMLWLSVLALLLAAAISAIVYRSWVDAQVRTAEVLAITVKVPVLGW